MNKERIKVKEKFGDYLMDISKYVFTAVMLTTLFNDLLTKVWIKCLVGICFVLLVTFLTIFYFYRNKWIWDPHFIFLAQCAYCVYWLWFSLVPNAARNGSTALTDSARILRKVLLYCMEWLNLYPLRKRLCLFYIITTQGLSRKSRVRVVCVWLYGLLSSKAGFFIF